MCDFEDNIETTILTGQKIANVHGYILKRCNLQFIIIKYLRPSALNESNTKGKINDLYNTDLDMSYKKNIINILVGKCSKNYNQKNISKVYLNGAECNYYA